MLRVFLPLLLACLVHGVTVDNEGLHTRDFERQLLGDSSALPTGDSNAAAYNGKRKQKQSVSTLSETPEDVPGDKETVYFQGLEGFDQTGDTIKSESCDHFCRCHFLCEETTGCQGWVYHSGTQMCDLKPVQMDSSNRFKCEDCIANDPSGPYTYECWKSASAGPTTTTTRVEEYEYEYEETLTEEEKAKREAEQAKLAPSEMASKEKLLTSAGDIGKYGKETGTRPAVEGDRCRFSEGFDQPADFNLMSKPLTLMEAYLCCDACTENPMCVSWVWNRKSLECWLKKEYDASKNTIVCADCLAYDEAGTWTVYHVVKGTRVVTETHTETKYDYGGFGKGPEELEGGECMPFQVGEGTAFKKASLTEEQKCTVKVGYDQPAEFNLPNTPVESKGAYDCCDQCEKEPTCKSWVWRASSSECYLKNAYDYRRATEVKCDDCVAYKEFGTYYVYPFDGMCLCTNQCSAGSYVY